MYEQNNKKRVLVVEDDRSNAAYFSVALKTDFEVDTVDNGMRGVCSHAKNPYDIIIMDYKLPEMHGGDAAQKIRSFDQSVPILCITGYDAYVIGSYASEFSEILRKPIHPRLLQRKVKDYLNLK